MKMKLHSDYEAVSINNADIEKAWEFCKKFGKCQPELNVIANYLFEEGLSVLGLLEAQKHGDFDLDMLLPRLSFPYNSLQEVLTMALLSAIISVTWKF